MSTKIGIDKIWIYACQHLSLLYLFTNSYQKLTLAPYGSQSLPSPSCQLPLTWMNKREQSAGPWSEGGCSRKVTRNMFFSGTSLLLLKCLSVCMENALKKWCSLMPILVSHSQKRMKMLRGWVTYVLICFLDSSGCVKAIIALEAFQYTLWLSIKITFFFNLKFTLDWSRDDRPACNLFNRAIRKLRYLYSKTVHLLSIRTIYFSQFWSI